ncbi:MAG TPA: hypothetical protein ENG30_00900 [Thermofilaceae archaeon]|nr:MAG: hypothetical protein DRJ43_03450 [Thermoprotei archaeon]HDD33688.1 hypothetical protein [Thermofilaceae archaeon]
MRVSLIIVARIVDALYKEGAMKKTRLQMASRLNYPAFMRYLKWLEERGIVTLVERKDGEYITLTEKGLETYEKLVMWVREYLGNF